MLKRVLVVALVLGMASSSPGETVASSLSLADAIQRAVEHNLEIQIDRYNPAQHEADINKFRGIYDTQLALEASYGESTTRFTATSGPTDSRSLILNSALNRLFWTGGTASLFFNNSYNSTNASSLSHYWQSSFGASLSQPLLKNLGREVTELSISTSRLAKFASIEQVNSTVSNIVARIRNEYFKLYNVQEQVKVKKISLELAQKILAETKARVAAGVLPSMEISNAEFGVASREKEMIDAETAVSDQLDVVRHLLQLEDQSENIQIVDVPQRQMYDASSDDLFAMARNRAEIRELKRNLSLAELQTRVYDNKLRPDLTLNASAALTGLDRTYGGDLDNVGTFDYPVWNIGVTLNYPLGNKAAENDVRKSKLKTEQLALQLRNLEQMAENDVKSAQRAIGAGFKQIVVADRGRGYAEERLNAFIRKHEVGLATTKDVLDVEADLAAAKSNQIAALVAYEAAITQLWLVTGDILERHHIRVIEDDLDRLYKDIR